MDKETRTWLEDRMFREMQMSRPEEWSLTFGNLLTANMRKHSACSPNFETACLSYKPEHGREVLKIFMADTSIKKVYMPSLSGTAGIAYVQIHNFLIHIANVIEGLLPDDFSAADAVRASGGQP